MFGYFAAALWIALPYLGILFVQPGYHQKYTELTLPQTLGLSSVPDFPSTVGLIVSAYLALRAVEGASWHAGVGSGLAAGLRDRDQAVERDLPLCARAPDPRRALAAAAAVRRRARTGAADARALEVPRAR